METWLVVLIHQVVFQGMFVAKNTVLGKKIGKPIRGKNKEATILIAFIIVFIVITLIISIFNLPVGEIRVLSSSLAMILGLVLLFFNLVISAASLVNLKDSWRVGVLED